MRIADNKAIVKDFRTAFSASNCDDALDMLRDDATWLVQGKTLLSGTYTKPEFAALPEQVTPQAPKGLRVKPKVMAAEDDRVSVEAESYGEITKGKTYENIHHFMFVLRDGMISGVREYLNTEHVTTVFGA